MQQKTIVTGIKPTGDLHLGNYIGMIKPALKLADSPDMKTYMFIADYHAVNFLHDPKAMRRNSFEMAAALISLGLDPKRITLFKQSDVPEVFELSVLLSAVTPKGLMNRAHAYKAATDKNKEAGLKDGDIDIGINMGLYTYPILMAADILVHEADFVPVGKDQVQHVEFTRDIAGSFNSIFGETLKSPQHIIQPDVAVLPGLDGRKMSKSYGNTIPVFADSKDLRKLIMKIKTDSKLPEESKDPDTSSIFLLYKEFSNADEIEAFRNRFIAGGMGYGEAKETLFQAVDSGLKNQRELFQNLVSSPDVLEKVLKDGAEQARESAASTLTKIRQRVGVR